MKHLLSWIIILVLLASCAPAPSEAQAPLLPLQDCTLSVPGANPVKARCGKLSVAEDPTAPDGAQIELNIAVIPAVSRDPAPDPLFLLAGGPGEAATKAFLPLLPAIDRLRFKRDLVMVDQRGTGASNPLDCPDPQETPEVLGVELPLDEQVAELASCRAALGADPALYGTDIAMGDLEQVRAALGYEQINLLGVSYGTRAALAYQRLYPERTRSLVLDGVVPPGWGLGSSLGEDAQRALEIIFARCAADSACGAKYPDLPATLDRLLDELEAAPVEVTVPDPLTAEPLRVMVTPGNLSAAVRLMTYSDLTTALLPLALHSAGQGDYRMIASQYLTTLSALDESLGMGMYFSVLCAEDEPLIPADLSADASYFDASVELLRSGCSAWREGAAAAPTALEGQRSADTPVLLISGEADPVTPPQNAEEVAALFANSAHIVAPGMGHANFYVSCIPDLVLDFVETASPRDLDTACVEKIQPMPFFLSPTGPQP